MTFSARYSLPVEETAWTLDGQGDIHMTWEYPTSDERLLRLYDKSKRMQWDASDRIDWSLELSDENPMGLDPAMLPLHNTRFWKSLSKERQSEVALHVQAHNVSQFLHGEQAAMIACGRLVQMVPGIDAKFCAATQAMDEARHVEVFRRLLHEKFEVTYPIAPSLRELLTQTLSDSRWDIVYLSMQVLVEGLALTAFQRYRDFASNELVKMVMTYVMQDEARHVGFGRLALKDVYPQLSQRERDEREEFVVEACYMLRDRFEQRDVWRQLDLPEQECQQALHESGYMTHYRKRLFTRIAPVIRDIGLLGKRVEKAFADMGVLEYLQVDTDEVLANDAAVAVEYDALRARIRAETEA